MKDTNKSRYYAAAITAGSIGALVFSLAAPLKWVM